MENGKRKVISFALAIVLCFSLGVNAFAAEPGTMATQSTDKLEVRVNGHLTQFPDAQPYIDENSRTLIPLRFVTEALGADVSWNQLAKIASVEKDGIRCDITIGSKAMAVTEDGKVDLQDAVAILQNVALPAKYPLTEKGAKQADVDGKDGLSGIDALVIQQVDAKLVKQEDLPLKK